MLKQPEKFIVYEITMANKKAHDPRALAGRDPSLNFYDELLRIHIEAEFSPGVGVSTGCCPIQWHCQVVLDRFMLAYRKPVSKTVALHASAALPEAKQGLVGLYFFLFNLSQHLLQKA